jgi:hypothetical protein
MSPLLLVKISAPLENSEIALIAARLDVYASVFAERYAGKAWKFRRKRHFGALQGIYCDLRALFICEALAWVHMVRPPSLNNGLPHENWSKLHK